jgi:hypothetical protein
MTSHFIIRVILIIRENAKCWVEKENLLQLCELLGPLEKPYNPRGITL